MPGTIPFNTIVEQDRRDPQAAAYMDEQGALMDAAVELMHAGETAHLSQEQLAEKAANASSSSERPSTT